MGAGEQPLLPPLSLVGVQGGAVGGGGAGEGAGEYPFLQGPSFGHSGCLQLADILIDIGEETG